MNRSRSERLDRLFNVMHRAAEPPISNSAVAEEIARRGVGCISADEIGQLRAGTKQDVTVQQLTALAEFFGVAARYLTEPEGDEDIESQLALLEALRDAGVRDFRRWASRPMSAQARYAMAETISRIR